VELGRTEVRPLAPKLWLVRDFSRRVAPHAQPLPGVSSSDGMPPQEGRPGATLGVWKHPILPRAVRELRELPGATTLSEMSAGGPS